MKNLSSLLVILVFMGGCGQNEEDPISSLGSDNEDIIEVGLDSVSESMGELDESDTNLQKVASKLVCDGTRYTPIMGSGSCAGTEDDKTVTSDFDGCSAGYFGQFDLSGQVKLGFDAPGTCDNWIAGGVLPTSGSVTRTTDNFKKTSLIYGYNVTISSTAENNYKGESIGGGAKVTFNGSERELEIIGLQRHVKSSIDSELGHQSITTTENLVASGTRLSGDLLIKSGKILVNQNKLEVDTTVTFENLQYDSVCRCPISGKMTRAREASGNERIFDFNTGTCGLINVTYSNGGQNDINVSRCTP